jgi:hypothetical protein
MIFRFYAQDGDKKRCEDSLLGSRPTAISGLNETGSVQAFTGIVRSVETGSSTFSGYPLRITMEDERG